jgi:hypothetical protein
MTRRVLTVEDNEDNGQILRDLFAVRDFDFIEAADVRSGRAPRTRGCA